MYPSDTVQKVCNTALHYVASNGRPVDTGNCILCYMRHGKKKCQGISPQIFLTCFQKVLYAVKLLDHCYKNELDNNEAKILFFSSRSHQGLSFLWSMWFWYWCFGRSQEFCWGHFDTNPPKKYDHHDNKGQATHCHKASFTNCDSSNDSAPFQPTFSSFYQLTLQLFLLGSTMGCLSTLDFHPYGFCNGSSTIKWTDCKMHNPVTDTQTAKDFDALCKAANAQKSWPTPSPSDCHSNWPPNWNHDSYASYHIYNSWCPLHHWSRSHSHDRYQDDCHEQHSYVSSHNLAAMIFCHHKAIGWYLSTTPIAFPIWQQMFSVWIRVWKTWPYCLAHQNRQ